MYEFTVSLLGVSPPIWRSIQVPATYTFWDLHVALQDAMGWLDCHLHLFEIPDPGSGEIVQIGIPDDDPYEGDPLIEPGWDVPIAGDITRPGVMARYVYDFGDGWQHDVTLEAIRPQRPDRKYPRCVDGERACPPEDCGGVGGYGHLLTVIRKPSHREHARMLEWLGGRFDPEKFDPRRVRFDDPARRYELAFDEPLRPARRRRLAKSATPPGTPAGRDRRPGGRRPGPRGRSAPSP